MSIPIWPAELPQRMNRDDFSRRLTSGRRLGSTDSGPPKSRRRFSRAARPISGSFTMTAAQLSRFWLFWEQEIASGSLPFWLPDQLAGGLPLTTPDGVRLLTAAGRPLIASSWWLVLFDTNDPVETVLGGLWRQLSVSLLEMP